MENLPGTLPGSSVILDTCGLRAAAGDVAAGCRAAIHNLKIIMMTTWKQRTKVRIILEISPVRENLIIILMPTAMTTWS